MKRIFESWAMVVGLSVGVWSGCGVMCSGVTIRIPNGFVGWVRVDLESSGCVNSGAVIEVDRLGVACVAGSLNGWTPTIYKYEGDATELNDRGPDGTRRVWAQSTMEWTDKLGKHRALGFFVGTHEQLLRIPHPRVPRID